jgi:hypothetical protein
MSSGCSQKLQKTGGGRMSLGCSQSTARVGLSVVLLAHMLYVESYRALIANCPSRLLSRTTQQIVRSNTQQNI